MLERIPLPLMYDWYWILFFNAGCFCSAICNLILFPEACVWGSGPSIRSTGVGRQDPVCTCLDKSETGEEKHPQYEEACREADHCCWWTFWGKEGLRCGSAPHNSYPQASGGGLMEGVSKKMDLASAPQEKKEAEVYLWCFSLYFSLISHKYTFLIL